MQYITQLLLSEQHSSLGTEKKEDIVTLLLLYYVHDILW